MTAIRFTKIQAVGNDFLILPVDQVMQLAAAPELARQLCERNYGAGADGIIFIAPAHHPQADFDSRIFNADGSEAEVSGNGTRCVAAYVYYSGLWSQAEVRIHTVAGVKTGRFVERDQLNYYFEFDMGKPRLTSEEIGMALAQPLERVIGYHLRIGGDVLEVTCTSMGNPHCTLFLSDVEAVNLEELGPLIEDHPIFTNRTNVEFVRVIAPDEIEVVFWERGVGRTKSSGTGSCGAAVAAALNGYTGRTVRINAPGGVLRVEWRDDDTVALTGSAEIIYEGRWLKAS